VAATLCRSAATAEAWGRAAPVMTAEAEPAAEATSRGRARGSPKEPAAGRRAACRFIVPRARAAGASRVAACPKARGPPVHSPHARCPAPRFRTTPHARRARTANRCRARIAGADRRTRAATRPEAPALPAERVRRLQRAAPASARPLARREVTAARATVRRAVARRPSRPAIARATCRPSASRSRVRRRRLVAS
jgi:hypothetical protein